MRTKKQISFGRTGCLPGEMFPGICQIHDYMIKGAPPSADTGFGVKRCRGLMKLRMYATELGNLTWTNMRIRQYKLIVIIAFCAFTVICMFLPTLLNPTAAVACFLCLLAASAAYYIFDRKRPQFETRAESICQGCKKQFVKAADVGITRVDEDVNQPAGKETTDDEVDTVGQRSEATSFPADKPGYHEMTDMFVNNLPNRLKEMREALDEGNLQDMALKVHELKDLGGFEGSGEFAEKAGALEQAVTENQIEKVRQQLDDMIQLCLKAKSAHR